MADSEKLVKVSVDDAVTKDSVSSIFPSSVDDDISVLYYPSEFEGRANRRQCFDRRLLNSFWHPPVLFPSAHLDDGEFNIWMVAMIAIGSLFLVFVGVTIFLIWYSFLTQNSCIYIFMISIWIFFKIYGNPRWNYFSSSREESSGCKRNASMAGAPSEFRTRVHRVSNASHWKETNMNYFIYFRWWWRNKSSMSWCVE